MTRGDSPYVTPERAAEIAGLLEVGDRDPKRVRSARMRLGRRIAAWNRREGRPFDVRVIRQGRALEAIAADDVRRMQDCRAAEQLDSARQGSGGKARATARVLLRRLPEELSRQLSGGRA